MDQGTESAATTPLSQLFRDPTRVRAEHPEIYRQITGKVKEAIERFVAHHDRDRRGRSRAPRPAAPRTRGSRRAGASSSTSSADPGDPDPEPRSCGGCGESLIGRAPQARYCDDACRMRARRLVAKPHRPIWTEAEIIALDLTIEPLPVIDLIMREPPGGYVPPHPLVREWATGPGRGHRAPVRHGRMAVA